MTEQRRGAPVTLRRRVTAEAVGTGFLVAAVVGSGIAAQRLSPNDVGLQLLENSLATGAALVALILALQPVSAAFNPVVTAIERLSGVISAREAAATVAAQVVGGVAGTVVANLMFGEPAVSLSGTDRGGPGRLLGEVVATAGLVLVITTLSRTGRSHLVAFVVGAYITAAYWFTSSTSFANPAVTVARMFTDSFAGIAPASAPLFLLAQAVGGAAGYGLARTLHPLGRQPRPQVLFVCVHNAGRSQMAAGYLQHLGGGAIDVRSAGSEPADRINPVAVQVMAEAGIDITAGQPRLLTPDAVRASDVVITMGCGDVCPFYPGLRYEDWVLADPAGQDLDQVRVIRDEIRTRVEHLVRELLPDLSPGQPGRRPSGRRAGP